MTNRNRNLPYGITKLLNASGGGAKAGLGDTYSVGESTPKERKCLALPLRQSEGRWLSYLRAVVLTWLNSYIVTNICTSYFSTGNFHLVSQIVIKGDNTPPRKNLPVSAS